MKARIAVFDNSKAFLIFCVILGHVVERFVTKSYVAGRVQLWIYIFHMPAFVFLAGLFSRTAVREKRIDKAFSYMFLFFFMKILFYAARVCVRGADKTDFELLSENGIPWFCLAMCWWYLITILIRRLPPAPVIILSLLLGVASGWIPAEGAFLVYRRTLVFYPCFYIGYSTDPSTLRKILEDPRLRAAGALVLTACLVLVFVLYGDKGARGQKLMLLFRGRYSFEEIGPLARGLRGPLLRLAAYAVSSVVTIAVLSLAPVKRTFFTEIGRRTLTIYVFHGPLITLLLGKFDSIKNWVRSGHLFFHCLLFSLAVLAITLLPPLNLAMHRITELPRKLAGFKTPGSAVSGKKRNY